MKPNILFITADDLNYNSTGSESHQEMIARFADLLRQEMEQTKDPPLGHFHRTS